MGSLGGIDTCITHVCLNPISYVLSHFSSVQLLCDPWTTTCRLLCPWDSPRQNTRVGCHALHQGIFRTQGSNMHILQLTSYAPIQNIKVLKIKKETRNFVHLMRTQWEGGRLQARMKALTKNRICQHLDLVFPRLQNYEKYVSVV